MLSLAKSLKDIYLDGRAGRANDFQGYLDKLISEFLEIIGYLNGSGRPATSLRVSISILLS